MKVRHFFSEEFCSDDNARTQEQLQEIAKKIRNGCKVKEICEHERYCCTVYENENLGLRYWVKDEFGHITEIDEAREY